MKDHETRRKIIREWMALPKDKRQGEEQVVAFAKKAAQQNRFHSSRRDPDHKFRSDPFEKVMGWLLPRGQVVIGPYSGVRNRAFANQIIDLYDGAVCETKASVDRSTLAWYSPHLGSRD